MAVTIKGVRIINLYVPNGESIDSPKYQYKLSWLQHLHQFLQQELTNHSRVAVLGDFNIAPQPIDVYDAVKWGGQVLFSPPERAALQAVLDLGLIDCFRQQNPEIQAFSWWDYRLNAAKRNMGLRIDLILASPALNATCTRCQIDTAPRFEERPSDHAPVIACFDLD